MTKVLVSIDQRLLDRLDHEAALQGISRSALIARLAAAALGEPMGPGESPDVHAALDRLKQLFRGERDNVDATLLIREMRDSR